MSKQPTSFSRAFTLIEIVVTLVIVGLSLAAVVPILSQAFMRSHEQPGQLRAAVDLHSAVEDIAAMQGNGTLAALSDAVGTEGSLFDGRFLVVHNRYVTFRGGAESGDPVHDVLLKITLRNDLGEQLTRLFAEAL